MYDPNKAPIKKETEPKLEETTAEVFSALKEKIRSMAQVAGTEGDHIRDEDIHHAAFSAALLAERAGEPYTMERIASMSDDESLSLLDPLAGRLKARPDSAKGTTILTDNQGFYVGRADSPEEAKEVIQEARGKEREAA